MQSYLTDAKNNPIKVGVEQFAHDMLGKNEELPDTLKAKFNGKGTKVINLETFKEELKNIVPASELAKYEQTAETMSQLQPQIKGMSILTEAQARDVLNGGHINNPEFLKEFFQNRFGNKFMKKYEFVAQEELDSVKKDLLHYVNSIVERARKTDAKEVTQTLLRKASSNNLKLNALNWGAGFVTSALFLSTLIPKMQYQITKWRTGSSQFPGTAQYREGA
jgi:hypothetical protein